MSADDLVGKKTQVKSAAINPATNNEEQPPTAEEEFFPGGLQEDNHEEDDFDFSDFEDDDLDAGFDRMDLDPDRINEIAEREHPNTRERAEKKGRILATKFNMVMGSVASWYGGGPRRAYKLDEDETDELAEAFADWLEVTEFDISPGAALIVTIITLAGPTAGKVWEDRKKKEERERFEEARRVAKQQEQRHGTAAPEAVAARVEVLKTKPKVGRKQFDVDANGYYEKSKGGKYIPKANRTEKATSEIEQIIMECKAKDPDVPQAVINRECCVYLYGSEYDKD